MTTFNDLVKSYGCQPCHNCKRYNPLGRTFFADNEFYKGSYWYYEGNGFYIDIHDFYIKKDYVVDSSQCLSPYMFLLSNYLISGSGECLDPYQHLGPNTMLTLDTRLDSFRYILHANCRFFIVGFKYKKTMIDDYILKKIEIDEKEVSEIFLDTRSLITRPLSKIAKEIIDCQMVGPSAELFYEAKAKEWLSIALDSYMKKKTEKPLAEEDIKAIEKVATYINDHYSLDISQDILEKIAMMSGTKLKDSFKKRFNMTITEYTQRKRINFAENLLLTSDLDIRDIARSVGYNSPSRFSTIFKRYKGSYPKDLKKASSFQNFESCDC